jgi:SAM-dependent methyltransferase
MADIEIAYGEEPQQEEQEGSQRERFLGDPDFMADAYSFLLKRTNQTPETDEEVYDKFMEHMRFHETNEVTAVRDLMYAQESDQDSKAEFARLLQRWDESEGDPMSATKALDYFEAGITAPSTWLGLISGGTGKVSGQVAVEAAKIGTRAYLLKEIGKGALKSAAVETGIGLGTGAAQEGTRVETGAQEEFTGERTATSAITQGIFGTIPGAISGFQQAGRRLDASQLRLQYESARAEAGKKAETKVRKVLDDAKRTDATIVEKTKGAILTDSVREARKFLDETKLRALPEDRVREGLDLLAGMTESEKLAASLTDNTLDKIAAVTIELGKKIKAKPGERITETIGRAIDEGKITDDAINDIISEFDLTSREFASIFIADASKAGKTLARQSKISRATRGTTTPQARADEAKQKLENVVNAFEEFDATIGFGVNKETAQAIARESKLQTGQDTTLQNLDRLRLSLMTAQIATTVRNTAGGAFRVAVDIFDKSSRNIISRGLGRADEITENPLAISEYLLFNQAEAKLVKQLFEENLPKEAGQFYGAFLETATVSSRFDNSSRMSKFGAAVNHLNRVSDNMYKQAIFAGRLDQLVRKNMGKNLHDVIAAGEFNRIPMKDMKEAIEESLDYLYQKTPSGTDPFSKGGRALLKLHRDLPFVISSFMPFPRFVINQLNFVAQHMPVIGMGAAKALGKQATDTDVLAKQVTGFGLLASAYYMRAQAGTDSEWYHVKTAEGELVDVRAIAGPLNAFLLGADILYRTNAGGKFAALLSGQDPKDVPDEEVMKGAEAVKATWQALGGPAFRAGTGLYSLDRIIEGMNSEAGFTLADQKMWATFAGDTINTFTLPLATARDVMSLTDEENRLIGESSYTNFWDIIAVRATRSLPTLESASLSEYISSTMGTGVVGEREERIDILTGEPMRYIDPLERQIFGISKRAEPNELQKEMMRLQIQSYDLFNPSDYAEEERLLRQLIAPKVAQQLNAYVLSDEYEELADEPKLKKRVLRDKVQEIVQEYRPRVQERIETEQQEAVEAGESTEIDQRRFEKLPARDRAVLIEQYEREFGEPVGENYRGALEFWENSVEPRLKQMAEGGFVDDPMSLSETAEEMDPETREQAGREFINQMTELGLDIAPVTGEIRSGQQALKDYEEGNYGMATLGALGALPIVGAPARAVRRGLGAKKMLDDLPPPEAAQRTQIPGTLPTYVKAKEKLDAIKPEGRTLDFGAGLGLGAKEMGADSYEPFAKEGFNPTFTKSDTIPSESYEKITNLNVLNVVPKNVRDDIVNEIGRVLKPGGTAVITTRGKDVMKAKGREGPEENSIITSAGTYQKGFTKDELESYIKETLGDAFEVKRLNLGPAGVTVTKKQ